MKWHGMDIYKKTISNWTASGDHKGGRVKGEQLTEQPIKGFSHGACMSWPHSYILGKYIFLRYFYMTLLHMKISSQASPQGYLYVSIIGNSTLRVSRLWSWLARSKLWPMPRNAANLWWPLVGQVTSCNSTKISSKTCRVLKELNLCAHGSPCTTREEINNWLMIFTC